MKNRVARCENSDGAALLRRRLERHQIAAEAARLDRAVQHSRAEPDPAGDLCRRAQAEPQIQTDQESKHRQHEVERPFTRGAHPVMRERREILRRVVEFQDFSVCWERDQAPARGLVAQVRDLVNVRDTFTRINLEREQERQERRSEQTHKAEQIRKRSEDLQQIRQQFFALFAEANPYKRGKALEAALNRYFAYCGILVTEAITLKGDEGQGIVEQIDGVVELKGLFLAEMKWEAEPLGRDKIASHLVRVFNRSLAGGLFISYSGYTPAAIQDCKDALREKAIVLCELAELVH